jgi:hypothetical protein
MELEYGRSMVYPYTYGYMYDDRSECDCIPYETVEMCQAKRIRYNCYEIKDEIKDEIKVNRNDLLHLFPSQKTIGRNDLRLGHRVGFFSAK